MTKEIFDGYKYIEGGVCAAKGFVANGLNCGINPVKEKFDLGNSSDNFVDYENMSREEFLKEVEKVKEG